MIYLIEQNELLKIGYTNNLEKRILQYLTHNSDFKLLFVLDGDKKVESNLHKQFSQFNVKNEWFEFNEKIIDYFSEKGRYVNLDFKMNEENDKTVEFQETFVVDDDYWLKVYANFFCMACDNLSGQAIKLFTICLKYATKDEGNGNYIVTGNPYFKKEIENKKIKPNLHKYLGELVNNGLLHRIERGSYRLNPEVVYCGDKHSRAKLIVKILNEGNKH